MKKMKINVGYNDVFIRNIESNERKKETDMKRKKKKTKIIC